VTSKVALFLALPALASSQAALTSWTRSPDPGGGMMARDIALTRADRMREAVAALHTVAKTQKISPDQGNQSITVEANAREAGLAEWLIGELDGPGPGPDGHGYVMPNDSDDVTLVLGGLRMGAIAAGAARVATLPDLQEIVNAIRVVCEITRVEAYPPTNALVWRGKAWQSEFALWLLRELANPPSVNWTAPISYRLDKTSQSVRIFYFAPETPVQELREILSSVRSKAPTQRLAVINAERAILLRGTDIEAAAAERVVAAARR
jgi:hypothetical protein